MIPWITRLPKSYVAQVALAVSAALTFAGTALGADQAAYRNAAGDCLVEQAGFEAELQSAGFARFELGTMREFISDRIEQKIVPPPYRGQAERYEIYIGQDGTPSAGRAVVAGFVGGCVSGRKGGSYGKLRELLMEPDI